MLPRRRDFGHPSGVLVHRLQLHDAAARGGLDQRADWYQHRVEADLRIVEDLIDDLIGQWRLDHIGEIVAIGVERQILETRLRRIVPIGNAARPAEMGLKPEAIQILYERAGAGAARACD